MKRLVSLALALCLLALSLGGCGKKKEQAENSQVSSTVSTPAPATPQPEKKAKAVKVNAEDGLNIRSEPSTDGEILGLAEDGSLLPLLVEKEEDGWFQISFEGKSAYVSAEFATIQEVTLEQYNKLKSGDASTGSSGSDGEGGSSQAGDDDPGKPKASPSPTPTPAPSSQDPADGEDGE